VHLDGDHSRAAVAEGFAISQAHPQDRHCSSSTIDDHFRVEEGLRDEGRARAGVPWPLRFPRHLW
jgi:hypothetical protein